MDTKIAVEDVLLSFCFFESFQVKPVSEFCLYLSRGRHIFAVLHRELAFSLNDKSTKEHKLEKSFARLVQNKLHYECLETLFFIFQNLSFF